MREKIGSFEIFDTGERRAGYEPPLCVAQSVEQEEVPDTIRPYVSRYSIQVRLGAVFDANPVQYERALQNACKRIRYELYRDQMGILYQLQRALFAENLEQAAELAAELESSMTRLPGERP